MGITTARVRIENLTDASRGFDDDFIVDTGAVLSFAPADRLAAIGVQARASGQSSASRASSA